MRWGEPGDGNTGGSWPGGEEKPWLLFKGPGGDGWEAGLSGTQVSPSSGGPCASSGRWGRSLSHLTNMCRAASYAGPSLP